MVDESLAAASSLLLQEARILTKDRPFPIDLELILSGLGLPGIEIVISTRKAHGVLRKTDKGHRPLLFRDKARPSRALSTWERFTIAHEIGHYLIERELSILPQRSSEYWALEDSCDLFARELLLPENLISGVVFAPLQSARDLLMRVRKTSQLAAAPEKAVSIRLIPNWSGCAVVSLEEATDRRDEVRARVRWSTEAGQLFGLRFRNHIKIGHVLSDVVAQHAQTGVGELRTHRTEAYDLASVRTSRQSLLVTAQLSGSPYSEKSAR